MRRTWAMVTVVGAAMGAAMGAVMGAAAADASSPAERLIVTGGPILERHEIGVIAERAVTLDMDAVRHAEHLMIERFDGHPVELRRQAGGTAGRRTTWVGSTDDADEHLVLAAVDEVVVGTFFSGTDRYALRPRLEGGSWLRQLDPAAFAPCATEPFPLVLPPANEVVETPVAHDPPDRIDVMVLYTPAARIAAGGAAAIEATITAAVAGANLSLRNSQAHPRFTVVHTQEAAYSGGGFLVDDLLWVRNHPSVHVLRDQYGADLVSLIVEDGGGFCGRANVQRNPGSTFAADAFSVVVRTCAVDNLSLAHELAHNQGCEHDPAYGVEPHEASFPWSFGHVVPGAFRTVMAYDGLCSGAPCPRQPLFSNPTREHQGHQTGIAGQRDNVRTINATASLVANFRPRTDLRFWDGFETADTDAWDQVLGE